MSVSHFCFSLGSDGAGDRFDAALVKNGWFLMDVLQTEMCFVSLKKKSFSFDKGLAGLTPPHLQGAACTHDST